MCPCTSAWVCNKCEQFHRKCEQIHRKCEQIPNLELGIVGDDDKVGLHVKKNIADGIARVNQC